MLNETFGTAGTAVTFFGGQWWLVGLFLLLLFVVFLLAYRVNAEGISIVVVLGLISVGSFQLFVISEQYVQTILFIIFMFVGYLVYRWISR